jgi:hypothetical protein
LKEWPAEIKKFFLDAEATLCNDRCAELKISLDSGLNFFLEGHGVGLGDCKLAEKITGKKTFMLVD